MHIDVVEYKGRTQGHPCVCVSVCERTCVRVCVLEPRFMTNLDNAQRPKVEAGRGIRMVWGLLVGRGEVFAQ